MKMDEDIGVIPKAVLLLVALFVVVGLVIGLFI